MAARQIRLYFRDIVINITPAAMVRTGVFARIRTLFVASRHVQLPPAGETSPGDAGADFAVSRGSAMTYVVTESCIKCKYTDCVDVCPVDCFHEGPNMLVIDPDECIDCTLCVAECPVEAIFAEDDVP